MSSLRLFLAICIFALLAVFVIGNAQPIRLQFLTFHTAEFPLFLALLGAFLLGALVAWIGMALGRTRRRSASGSSRKDPGASGPGSNQPPVES